MVAAVLALAGCDERPATWAYISPVIFQANCATASCHSRGTAVAGLDFSTPDRGYASLARLSVVVPGEGGDAGATAAARRPLVTPYDPQQSRVIMLLRARGARRMPPDRPLDEADIRLVESWILNGALKGPPTDAGPAPRDARAAGAAADADAGQDVGGGDADGGDG